MSGYERVEVGIARFGNRYRAFVSRGGKGYQKYFDAIEDAREWREKMRLEEMKSAERPRSYIPTTKRKNIKHQDLPIGLNGHQQKSLRADGSVRIDRWISASIIVDGLVVKTITARYRKGFRTKQQATDIVLAKRNLFEKMYWRQGKTFEQIEKALRRLSLDLEREHTRSRRR